MKITGNTIFITGGSSGIGRALAVSLHKLGNTVIIGGRRQDALAKVAAAYPGIFAIEIDISDAASIEKAAKEVIAKHPKLNFLINNAGSMILDNAAGIQDGARAKAMLETNLLGPILLTSELIEHLKTQPNAVIAYTTSVVGFIPLVPTSVYSAAKAGLHVYAVAQRFLLQNSGVRVLEIIPPWVDTDLIHSPQSGQYAMPVDKFVAESIELIRSGADEILVESARPFRDAVGANERVFLANFSAQLSAVQLHETARLAS